MRIGHPPLVTPIASRRPSFLGVNGIVIEHLKVGDKVSLKNPLLGKGEIEVKNIELGEIGFSFNGLSSHVTVYDSANDPLLQGKRKLKNQSPNLSGGFLKLKQLNPTVTKDFLKPGSLGIVLNNGNGSELQLFLDYACPSVIDLGTVCNLGFVASNLQFGDSEVIAKERNDYAKVVLPIAT